MDMEYLASKIQCSKEDKFECIPLIKDIINLANTARRQGLIILEEQIEANKNCPYLLKRLILLITDGRDVESVEKIASTYIVVGNYNGKEFLENILIMEGCLMLQQGIHPTLINAVLFAYLGLDFLEEENKMFEDVILNQSTLEKLNNAVNPLSDKTILLEQFNDMDNRSIQRILRDVDIDNLTFALLGASSEIRKKFLDNLSTSGKKIVNVELVNLYEQNNLSTKSEVPFYLESNIVESQNKILNTVCKLVKSGDIIVTSEDELSNTISKLIESDELIVKLQNNTYEQSGSTVIIHKY